MDIADNSEKSEEVKTQIGESSKDLGNETKATKDELDSILDDALGDFDKYQSSSVDPVDQEAPQRKTEPEQEMGQINPELPPLPADQEAFFNAVFNNPEAQQMFSGMNDAFAGLMSGFEQISQDPELKNEMDQMMQNMMGGGAAASEPPRTAFPSPPPQPPPRPSGQTAGEGEDLAKTLGDTMHKLAESAKDVKDGNIPQEDIMKAFENLNMEGGDDVLLPMVQNMMENLLSKDVLYPSLKEVTDKYPQWLEENKGKLSESDYERYCKQQGTMYRVCQQYEEESDSDPPQVKKDRIMKIMNLIQEMESYGEPPKEIVGDMPSTGLQFDERGLPKIPGMPSGDQCNIM
ncbi:peroxisomal biogenesis factor 19-like [Apostichopus japonicus]|uniref:peroxisomal biogenesis factor 19-like n=1 Tax=Stichopus japonicus TaxID=307972 RepID=UPI003AB52470